jgi:hypothetical protein
MIKNRAALPFEIVDQRSSVLPVDKRAGLRNAGQPFADLLDELTNTLRAGQLQAEAALGGGVLGAELEQ